MANISQIRAISAITNKVQKCDQITWVF